MGSEGATVCHAAGHAEAVEAARLREGDDA